jgi:hypothetical protein
MKTAYASMEMIHEMARIGNPNSVSDAELVSCVQERLLWALG